MMKTSSYSYSIFNIFLLSIILFLMIGSLFQPGELNLFSPTHSDLYRYFVVSQNQWIPANWLMPRPLSGAYVKVVGFLGQPNALFVMIAIPAFIFMSLVAWLLIDVELVHKGTLPIIAFFLVALGSPMFYPHFQLDFGGMLGGIFAVLAVHSGLKSVQDDGKYLKYWWLLPLFFTMFSVESKPNYSFALLFLAFVAAIVVDGKRSKWLFAGILTVLVWVYIKDKFIIGSPYIAAASADSPYAVVIDPWRNIKLLWFYIRNSFTPSLIVTVVAACIALLVGRQFRLLSILLGLAIATSIPMALLVNRPWDTYAWYSTVILAAIVMVAFSRLILNIKTGVETKMTVFSAVLLLIMTISMVTHALSRHTAIEWTLGNQRYNANVLSTLDLIKTDGIQKILLAGLQGPYHPLKNSKYIEQVFPEIKRFDVLLRKSERVWNDMSNEQYNGIYLSDATLNIYSKIYVFNSSGRLAAKLSADEVSNLENHQQTLLFLCGKIDVIDPTEYALAIECLNANEEYLSSIDLGRRAVDFGNIQPWIYFHLAKAYQASNDRSKATELLDKALSIEPDNRAFKLVRSEI